MQDCVLNVINLPKIKTSIEPTLLRKHTCGYDNGDGESVRVDCERNLDRHHLGIHMLFKYVEFCYM